MKTTRLLLFLFVCLATHASAQSTPDISSPETMVIKVLESNSFGITNNLESRMIVINSENQTEIKPLKRVNYNTNYNEGLEYNAQKLQLELQIWQNKGFSVKSMTTVTPRDFVTISTIVLQKG